MSDRPTLADTIRLLKNRIWQQHGPEGLEQVESEIETCKNCGHRSEAMVYCPVCGREKAVNT